MPIRIEWDESEIALLIEACEEVLSARKSKSDVVKRVSSDLRKRAVSRGITIDEVFRNEAGITLQMQKMIYLLTHGDKGMPGESKLYAEVAELRESNPQKFKEILKKAKEEIEMIDFAHENIDRKALFIQWISEHPIKKYSSSAIVDALDVASRYCISHKICKEGLWGIQSKAEFNAATSKLLSFRIFRLTHKYVSVVLDKAIPLYKDFLNSYETAQNNTPAGSHEKEATSTLSAVSLSETPPADGTIQLNFSNIGRLAFSKPVKLKYKNYTCTDFNSWASLYIKMGSLLRYDYPQIIADGTFLPKASSPEFSANPRVLRQPRAITDNLYIETNHSATEIASKIVTLLNMCGVNLGDVSINYTLKNDLKSKNINQPKSEKEKLYDKLYSISRIYDDPTGLSLNKIMGLLGQNIDSDLVQNILDHATWSHKIADEIYSFASVETSSVMNEKTSEKISAISDFAFYDYLDKTLGMSEPTCRSYVSAIRSAENYAKEHGFASCRIYDVDTSKAVSLIEFLVSDEGFSAYNLQQHNRFRAAFTKFADMAGLIITFGKPSLQRQEKAQENPVSDFDKDKYIEVLMNRYRNGITFDSIDFDNFREIYESFNDYSIDVDDAMLEKQLRLCGVFYNDRLFPAEGIMDVAIKAKLFAYIENSFSSGKKVLYYKAIFEDLTDDFASCYTLADENMLRDFIEFTAEDGKYYFFKDYMSTEANVKIDNTAEVEEFLLSAGKPMKVEDVCTALTHIPEDKVDSIIKFDSRFRRNAKGEYFHVDIFEISDGELEKIASIIDGFIAENDYAIWTDVWNKIQETMTVFLENNLYLSALGVRNAIVSYYDGRFNFNGAVISRPTDGYEMRDVYQLYAKHHPTFTADDIYNLSKELDTVIYFDALSKVSVRVSHDLFISKDQISFDVDAVDRAIGSFLSKDYIRIREIDSYLVFPNVGYEWNEYLLESFLLSYSKKFELLNNGLSLNNVAGFVVKKNGQIKEFADACADFIADGRIELKKADALNYLVSTNVISRRSYKDIDLALRRATQIRARKG